MIKNLLVPVDYSSNSDAAIHYAFHLSKMLKWRITFLHVHDTGGKEETEYNDSIRTLVLEDYIRDFISNVKDFSADHIYACAIAHGDPAGVIAAASADAGLVIMGLKEAGRITRMLAGGTVWKVISTASCPVITVPEKAVFHGLSKILFASDFRYNEIGALQFYDQLIPGAAVTVVHVGTGITKSGLAQWYSQKISENIFNRNITLRVIRGRNVIAKLSEIIEEERAQLVSFCINTHRLAGDIFAGNLAAHMMAWAQVPVLFFRKSMPVELKEEL